MLTVIYFIYFAVLIMWVFFMLFRICTIKEEPAFDHTSMSQEECPNNVVKLNTLSERKELIESGELLLQSELMTDLAFEGLSEDAILKINIRFRKARAKNLANLIKLGILDPQTEKSKLKKSK
ncbi:hypothetical protein L1285_20940 [Pseudoalteromonas sp. DL2-H2.2]|uniref:hypothetical protein n=1 Tax=Pseudoalteromonas sp. DL2-H2.2 TaxID=2908889 RepID=UPI001F21637C|nr:hypothetical protein [Pseudoalteromonas sp. DL2-H2.2]MCF2910778.1 hypothetical protein [Pseudoalteromonas sp. DL2-H2.2]